MNATATVHITQDVHSLYHARSALSFDPAPRIQPAAARIHDIPAPHHRMPQPQQVHNQQPGPPNASASTSRVDKVGIPAMTTDGVVMVDDHESRCVLFLFLFLGDKSSHSDYYILLFALFLCCVYLLLVYQNQYDRIHQSRW